MADITVTAANVVPQSDAVLVTGKALSAVTAGQPVYRDTTTRKFAPADTDHGTAINRVVFGIAVNGAAADQTLTVQTAGTIDIGATTVVGVIYVLSGTAGGIAPAADLATGDYTTVLGIGVTTANIKLGIFTSGLAAS